MTVGAGHPTVEAITEQTLRRLFARSADVVVETYIYGSPEHPLRVVIAYCEGVSDSQRVSGQVLHALHDMLERQAPYETLVETVGKTLQLHPLPASHPLDAVQLHVYSGDLVLLFEGLQRLYSLDIADPPNRQPAESSTEVSIKGPRDAFTEDVITNIALIRKRMKSNTLNVEKFEVGERTRTTVAFLYIDDIASPSVVEEVRQKLSSLRVDGLVSTAQLEEYLSGRSFALFPLLDYVGRPDYCIESLLRGRIVVLADGSPMAVIGPANLMVILKSPEDVHLPFYYVALERLLRIMGMCVAVFLPGFWISVSGYNLDQIPFPLLATIASARLGLPLSGPVDFFLMLILFELFREAGLRLPKAVGQTVAVVGGLIIGDAAINAGITGPVTLVVAALSTMSMFTLINQSLAGSISVLRISILFISFAFGMFGFILAVVALALYLSTLESLGVPYMAPLSPPRYREMAAALMAVPWRRQKKRPSFLHSQDKTRRDGGSE